MTIKLVYNSKVRQTTAKLFSFHKKTLKFTPKKSGENKPLLGWFLKQLAHSIFIPLLIVFSFRLTGGSGYQAANHRSPPDWATRTPLRGALCSQGSRVLRQEQGLQTSITLDHGHHEPPGRVTSRARPQVESEVRDRSAVQDAEHRAGLPTTWEPPKSGCSDSKLRTQVPDAAGYQPGNGLCTYFFTF